MAAHTINAILDTDMGPDCDDAGALAVLHALADQGKVNITGLMYCTSISTGPACIDAINRFYNRPNISIGALAKDGFLCGPQYEKYTPIIAAEFEHRFKSSKAPDAVGLYRKILSESPDSSLDIIGIGPFINLADLLNSSPDLYSKLNGVELVKAKVRRLVAMAGGFTPNDKGVVPAEWNVVQDLAASQMVMRSWPTSIVLSPSEVGGVVMTGKQLMARGLKSNPVKRAYDIYTEGYGRNSWDLVTVYYAVCGLENLWELSEPGTIEVDSTGVTRLCANEKGNHRYMISKAPIPEVEQVLEALLNTKN